MKDKKELFSIEGEIGDIIFQSDESGYTVCSLEWEREPVTLVGILPGLMVGDCIRAMGEWVNHPSYGKQFKAVYFEKQMPVDENAMLRYLSSRAIHGVGPKLAAKIVERFGEDSFDVIENNPALLSDIPGISVRKAKAISEDFRRQFGVRNIMMFFSGYFGMTTSVRIYKRWGNQAVDVVKKNPYLLCEEIFGIGFERADAMAAGLGIEKDAPERIRAGLHYVLKYNAAANGHCYLPKEKLTEAAASLLDLPMDTVGGVLEHLCGDADLIAKGGRDHCAVYLPDLFRAESHVASQMIHLSRINLFGSIEGADQLILETEQRQGIRYDPAQRAAIRGAVEHSVTLITGGPGTGKTTIVKAIVNLFQLVGMNIALAAPTGRAAKRMQQSTGYEAKTIHRLLEMEYSREEPRFLRNENHLLDADVIIVDEVSMVDIQLFSSLLKAIRPGCRLVLIGDSDQLPSVGPGQVLHDTIFSQVFPVYRLEQIFRQQGGSDIVENAHRINRGESPVASGKEGDFFLMQRLRTEEAVDTVVSLCKDRLPKRYGEEIRKEIQVLSCTRKGDLGTVNLNLRLQAALNPPSPQKREKQLREKIFREEDKVMQIRNNYDAEWVEEEREEKTGFGVFNGDIGTIVSIDHSDESVTVNFDGKLVRYGFDELDEIEHAFAVTVHKSQGSEYPVVILPVLNPPPMLSTRNLLYTAVTRAKKMAILVGDRLSVDRMVSNNRKAERYTGLGEMYRIFKENASC